MILGIVSDSHGFVSSELLELLRGVDHILHAGDVGSARVLRELEKIAPTTAVRGNIDGDSLYFLNHSEVLEIEGIEIVLIHHAGDPLRPRLDLCRPPLSRKTKILVSGHFHHFWVHSLEEAGLLWLSPGACGNSGHHTHRSAMRLEIPPAHLRCASLLSCLKLEKLHLGLRGA